MYLKWTRNFIIRLCLLVYSSSSKRGRGLSGGISSSSSLWSSFVGPRAHTLPWEMIIIKRSSSCCCYSPVAVPALLLLLPTHYVFSTSLPPLANPLFVLFCFNGYRKSCRISSLRPAKWKWRCHSKMPVVIQPTSTFFSIKWQFINSTADSRCHRHQQIPFLD